ncbi:unnamed protein product [Parnassius apollo]|uniref:(apollo) hypothetical protein n=1 Tax=Parnassius apollo TaxID=110799 RepID=A0A8S3Y1Y9_PARAO|nr:unnamed protein product [Parnassius apollo]
MALQYRSACSSTQYGSYGSTVQECVCRGLEGAVQHWEQEAGAARELAAARQHQLATLGDLLDAAKAKLAGAAEGEAAAAAAARREADAASARAHALAERLAHAQRQLDRAHDDARRLHDDALVSRNNAKSTISELEFQLEQLRQEKAALQGEVKTLQENISELQIQVQVASDEKLALMSRAGEALARASDLERQLQDARARHAQLARDRDRDEAEWKQFQSDLLMTVRVANDFKTEAQRELERLVSENKIARDRIRLLEDQIHSMKGFNRSDSTDSVQNCSDDDKSFFKESDDGELQDDNSSKAIFRNIRTRYLSRVHSVSDPSLKDTSIVDQAFFKLNSASSKEDLNLPKTFKIDIKNVTTDETNDDEISKEESFDNNTERIGGKIIAEAVLPPFRTKELMRQNAIDFYEQRFRRQDALDCSINLDLSSYRRKLVSKSVSSDVNLCRSKTKSTKHFSSLYNGKLKSLSMDNLSSSHAFKDVLKEATSIEFLGSHNFSDISLYTDGSDSVFLSSPTVKNNNVTFEVEKNTSFSPKACPNEFKEGLKNDVLIQPLQDNIPLVLSNEIMEKDLKKVNEELKLNFKAAIDRMASNNKSENSSSQMTIQFDKPKVNNGNVSPLNIDHKHTFVNGNSSLESCAKTENYIEKTKEIFYNGSTTSVLTQDSNVNANLIKGTYYDDFNKQVKDNIETTLVPTYLQDDVSYRLKIHTLNDASTTSTTVATHNKISNTWNNQEKRKNQVKTFLAPINIVNANIDITDSKASPIIISPVLIQPIFFKANTVAEIDIQKPEPKRGTVYYDDIDQVVVADTTSCNKSIELPQTDSPKKKGMYQKNVKVKQLPNFSWKSSSENLTVPCTLDSNIVSKPVNMPKSNLSKISKTPEWLIDNHYYQPLEPTPIASNRTKVNKCNIEAESNKILGKCTSVIKTSVSNSDKVKECVQENYYEEIGQHSKNVADDEKISNQMLDDLPVVTREEILKVPRKPKRPKKQETKQAANNLGDTVTNVKEVANFTKSVISLSRSPSAKDLIKNQSSSIGGVVQNLEKKSPLPDARRTGVERTRKLSLQGQKVSKMNTNTGSLPREPKTYHWKTLEHKRLSHPIRSLNDPLPSRPLRKLGFFVTTTKRPV